MPNFTLPSRPPSATLQMPRKKRWSLYGAFGILLVTGFMWLALRFLDVGGVAYAPWRAWSMRLHGAAAFASMFLLGAIWSSHMSCAWKQRRNRLAGVSFASAVAALVLTGYGLYYFNGEGLRSLSEWVHCTVGVMLGFLFWNHLARGRRELRR